MSVSSDFLCDLIYYISGYSTWLCTTALLNTKNPQEARRGSHHRIQQCVYQKAIALNQCNRNVLPSQSAPIIEVTWKMQHIYLPDNRFLCYSLHLLICVPLLHQGVPTQQGQRCSDQAKGSPFLLLSDPSRMVVPVGIILHESCFTDGHCVHCPLRKDRWLMYIENSNLFFVCIYSNHLKPNRSGLP